MKLWMLCAVGLTALNLSGCVTKPLPCACPQLAEELDITSDVLANALRDKGVLRHQLQACQEKR